MQNRTAVITGATGGLGSVMVRDLAAQGANLALIGRDQGKLETLAKKLSLPPERFLAHTADLIDPHAVQSAADAVLARFGRVDIVLHLTGGWTGGKPLVEVPSADLNEMLNQHIWTTFHVTQAFIPPLLRNGWGRVVIVSSPTANQYKANSGPYAAAKAGQEALILTLAQELQGSGVTANVLQVRTIDVKHDKTAQPSSKNAAWTTPEEISAAIFYLLSEQGAVVNGARIPLFAGYSS